MILTILCAASIPLGEYPSIYNVATAPCNFVYLVCPKISKKSHRKHSSVYECFKYLSD